MNKASHIEVEKRGYASWEQFRPYVYQTESSKEDFVIDTPPPTVSGELHIGHIFSYSQTDIIARFQRMSGKNVLYPMGWDDNGLPTEKRAQKLYNVYCDPLLVYDPELKRPGKKNSAQAISRKNFLEICKTQVEVDELKYRKVFNQIGLSVDWRQNYQTIGPLAQSLAQLSFLDLLDKDLIENRLSPVLWDTQFQTAVAQADIEDRPKSGLFHTIYFSVKAATKKRCLIATTRPELLPACVALAAHPEDSRYKDLFGKMALTPLFSRKVPIIPSSQANPEKGTGILMICTYGDMEDARFCQKQQLPVLQIIDERGFLKEIDFEAGHFQSENPAEAKAFYSHLKGLRVLAARQKIAEILSEKGFLKGQPEKTSQNVKFYEKGDYPLEILPKRQWYIKLLNHKEELLHQGEKILWHPPAMRKRYEQWVQGLNQDWCISRQRPYGVPFPVWHQLNKEGNREGVILTPPFKREKGRPFYSSLARLLSLREDSLEALNQSLIDKKSTWPIDPLHHSPSDFKEKARDQRGGFSAEMDVMDTWAVSSLTPCMNIRQFLNADKKFLPADLRPQSYEIIRTWAFYTIAKAWFHEKAIPWKNIAISGWVLTPDRMKMSKSKGKALQPEILIQNYSADALRYWAGKSRLGQNSIYDENVLRVGKRLREKLLNSARFVQIQSKNLEFQSLENLVAPIDNHLDRAWLLYLIKVFKRTLALLQDYKHAEALEMAEKSFWLFCDNFLELIKGRVYQLADSPDGLSGIHSLNLSLYFFLKAFAPFLPYITEEIWGKHYLKESESLHSSFYPSSSVLLQAEKKLKLEEELGEAFLRSAFSLLERVRGEKSRLGISLACKLKQMEIKGEARLLKEFELYREDLARAAHISPENILTQEQRGPFSLNIQPEL